jgi:hypothetical protein
MVPVPPLPASPPVVEDLVSYQLNESASVLLDGSGNGTVRISPGQPGAPGSGVGAGRNSGLTWDLQGVAVSVATNRAEAAASCYVSYGIQSSGPADLQGTTITGSTGDTCSVTAQLRPGDWIAVKWTGGDPGAIAVMRVFGTVNPPGA